MRRSPILPVTLQVADDVSLYSVSVYLAGALVTAQTQIVKDSAAGLTDLTFNFTVPSGADAGDVSLTAVVTDGPGNRTTATRVVQVDPLAGIVTAPGLTITRIYSGAPLNRPRGVGGWWSPFFVVVVANYGDSTITRIDTTTHTATTRASLAPTYSSVNDLVWDNATGTAFVTAASAGGSRVVSVRMSASSPYIEALTAPVWGELRGIAGMFGSNTRLMTVCSDGHVRTHTFGCSYPLAPSTDADVYAEIGAFGWGVQLTPPPHPWSELGYVVGETNGDSVRHYLSTSALIGRRGYLNDPRGIVRVGETSRYLVANSATVTIVAIDTATCDAGGDGCVQGVIVTGLTTPYGLAWWGLSTSDLLIADEGTNAIYLLSGTF